ncbi:DUF4262 domain-containing protein [Prauserella muralis]|uniref:Uncharacterized protein n=1 Tax=Prauserella muralis TaxID=588067 RepID=A0A2V4AI54_9PSEU|nr:DUF4262 domain-containing protein [Prauserella muralis]PXY19321.1 hypothetical protein BAY60_31650 [Prauserella muralis]TWE29272.1 uncharacterized protein DUF4262 [Prauserella muralis]
METPEFITHVHDQHDAWLRATIERLGWAVTYVHGEDGHPPFGYTIGLTEHGNPELIMFGTTQDTTAYALNELARRFRVEGMLGTGAPVGFEATAHRVWLVPVRDSSEHLLWANRRYRESGRSADPRLAGGVRRPARPFPVGRRLHPAARSAAGARDTAGRPSMIPHRAARRHGPPDGARAVSRAGRHRTARSRPPPRRRGPEWPPRR